MKTDSALPLGYSSVPRGCIANIATFLEMKSAPHPQSEIGFPPGYSLRAFDRADIGGYRALFRKVGEKWLWLSRLSMPEKELGKILNDPLVDILALTNGIESVGLLELDFREPGECELAFFGLIPGAIGKGLGRALMNEAIRRAWARPIRRFWVHTCSLDHPAALDFYVRAGFRAYALKVEVQRDPRLTGLLPRSAGPHVPLIEDEERA